MRVIVCGGRDYNDAATMFRALTEHGVTWLAEGGANGADWLARHWALSQSPRVPVTTYPADWEQHGKAAGPIRNQFMLENAKPDAVIAFPGGKGTADMVRRAKAAGVCVIEVEEARDDG